MIMSKIEEGKEKIMSISLKIAELDTRIDRCKIHSAEAIVFITISAVLCGCRTWNDIEDFGWSKLEFFRKFLGGLESVPSHDTISRFFKALKPDGLEERYRDWVRYVIDRRNPDNKPPERDEDRDVVAVDGKTIRRASETDCEKKWRKRNDPVKGPSHSRLHVVSAYSTSNGISLGQVKVDGKSNEIPAVRELLGAIDVEGCIISADALNCQKSTVEAIVRAKAKFMLTVKANQEALMTAIWKMIWRGHRLTRTGVDSCVTQEYEHGRQETRECYTSDRMDFMAEEIREQWPWVKTVGEIITTRQEPGKEAVSERRCFISNLESSTKLHMNVSRKHWQVENNLHWQLDVNFMEDEGRKKNNEALNFSTICKIALAALNNIDDKRPVNRRMKVAGWNDDYLLKLLQTL